MFVLKQKESKGYYSGNSNIVKTLVDCSYDLFGILGKGFLEFGKWVMSDNRKDFSVLWKETRLYNTNGDMPLDFKFNDGYRAYTYMFTIPIGLAISDFLRCKEEIAQFLSCSLSNLRIQHVNNLLAITVYKEQETSCNYEDYIYAFNRREFAIPMGIDVENYNIVYWRPLSENECHLLIAGNTGSGKSTCVYTILTHLISLGDKVELYLQDVKMVDMCIYENVKQVVHYNQGKDYAIETSKHLVNEMEDRYKYLAEHKCRNMSELPQEKKLKPIFYVVEELATFDTKDVKDKEFFKNLDALLSKARAVNIIVIVITQSPYHTVLPGELKNNFPLILGLKTRTGEASKVISGDYDLLTELRGKGHGVILTPMGNHELQCFNIQKETIEMVVSKNQKEEEQEENKKFSK